MKTTNQEDLKLMISVLEEKIDKNDNIHKEKELLDKLKQNLHIIENRKNNIEISKKSKANNILFMIFALLGTLFIAGGILFLFAYNWSHMPKSLKIVISVLPLIISQIGIYFTYSKNKSRVWVECFSIAVTLSVILSNALIAQTLQITVPVENLLFLSILLSLPINYLFKPKYNTWLYMILSIVCLFSGLKYMIIVGALMAYYFYNDIKSNKEGNRLFKLLYLFWIFTTISITLDNSGFLFPIILGTVIILILFSEIKLFNNVGVFVLLMITNILFLFDFFDSDYNATTVPELFFGALILAIFVFVVLFFDISKNSIVERFLVLSSLGIILICNILSYTNSTIVDSKMNGVSIFFEVYFVALLIFYVINNSKSLYESRLIKFGLLMGTIMFALKFVFFTEGIIAKAIIVSITVFYIVLGVKKEISWFYKFNIFMINMLLILEVFSSDFGLVAKGLLFIVMGIVFLITNYYIVKRERRNK